jgi:hypothetical protein
MYLNVFLQLKPEFKPEMSFFLKSAKESAKEIITNIIGCINQVFKINPWDLQIKNVIL